MSLYSGKRIHGYKWEKLPIDENVIARVEQLAEAEKQPIMNRGMPCFEWTPGVEIEDEPDEEDEQQLTIANECTEVQEGYQEIGDVQQEPAQLQDVLVDIDPDIAGNDQARLQNRQSEKYSSKFEPGEESYLETTVDSADGMPAHFAHKWFDQWNLKP